MKLINLFISRVVLHLILCLFLLSASFSFLAKPAQAANGVNYTINFQGKVVNSNGTNVADSSYTMKFRIYDSDTGGSSNLLWGPDTKTISTTSGVYQTEIGDVTTPLSTLSFNRDDLWLEIEFNTQVMSPRIHFQASAYALNSKLINGMQITDTSDNPFASTTTQLKLPNGNVYTIAAPQTGTTDTIPTLTSVSTLTYKTIGSTGLTFSGATTDITTGTNEDFTIAPNGTGDVITTLGELGQFAINATPTSTSSQDAFKLTLNAGQTGTTGTFQGLVVSQADTATTGVYDSIAKLENLKTPETTTNGLYIENNAASGTLSNAINITNTAGTLTNGIAFSGNITTAISIPSGTYTNYLDTSSIDISGAGAISGATGLAVLGTTTINNSGSGNTTIGNASSTTTVNIGSDATGDLLYRSSGGYLARLAIGTGSECLKGGTTPGWGSCGTTITADSLDYIDFEDTLDLDANLITNQTTYTSTQNFTGTTTTGLTYNANSLTTGTAMSIASTSTAGGASGASYLLNLSRSGTNANTDHTAYGLYSTVTNTNVTSGTNIAGYFSASGATTANYGVYSAAGTNYFAGNVGINTAPGGDQLYALRNSGGYATIHLSGQASGYGAYYMLESDTSYAYWIMGGSTGGGFANPGVAFFYNANHDIAFSAHNTGPMLTLTADDKLAMGGNFVPVTRFDVSGLTLNTDGDGTIGAANFTHSVTKNDGNVRAFASLKIKPTINTGGGNGSTTLNVLDIDTVNSAVTGVTTNLIKASYGASQKFLLDSSGTITIASGQSYTGAGALAVQSGSATNLSLLAGTAAEIQVVQVGAGGAGSTTPDYFALDVKSNTGDPAGGAEGYMYYNTNDNKFRCFQGAAWTDCITSGTGITADSLDYVDFEDTLDLDANLITNQTTFTSTQNFTGTTTTGLTYNANSLTTGTAMSIASTSTAGGASGASYLLNLSRSGTNANTDHTAYGLYSTVTNTNVTSGTNIAGYFSASGATTANYAAIFAAGNVGIGKTNPSVALDVTGAGTFSTTLTASSNFTLTTGALNLTATSGSTAITGYGTSSLTSTTATGNIVTYADSSLAPGIGATANLMNLTFTNAGTAAPGTSYVAGLNIAGTNNAGGGGGGTFETYGIRLQSIAGTAVAGTQNNFGIRIGNYGESGAETSYGLYVDAQSGSGTANYAAIFAGGNVGVGLTNPADKLSLSGSSAYALSWADAGTVKGLIGLAFSGGDYSSGSVAGDLVVRTVANNILFSNNNGVTTHMYLKSDGFVGIGTSTPTAHKLQVAGGNIGVDSTYGLDTNAGSGTLSLGVTNATTINIGIAGATTNVLGTGAGALDVAGGLYVGGSASNNFQVGTGGAVTFSAVATDITTGTNEDFTIAPNGTGDVITTLGELGQFAINATPTSTTSQDAFKLTLNAGQTGTTGTFQGLVVSQADTATTGVYDSIAKLENLKTPETTTNGLYIENNAASGTLSNAINITNTAGTLTTGISMTGTFTNYIDTANFDVSNAGNITVATTQGLDCNAASCTLALGTTNATTITMGGSGTNTLNIGTGTGVDTIHIGDGGTGVDVISIGTAGTSNWAITSSAILTLGKASTTTGQLKLYNSGNANTTIFQTSGTQSQATITYTLPLDDGTPSQVLQTDGSGVLSWATPSGGGLFTQATGFAYLTTTTDDLVLGGSTVAAGSFFMDVSAGMLYLGTNNTGGGGINGGLTFYSSGNGISDASIVTDASGNLNISAPAGTVQVGSGTGNIALSLTGAADVLSGTKVYTLAGAYTASDFSFTRTLTGGTNNQGGKIFSIVDSSTATSGTLDADLLYIQSNITGGGTFTGNLLKLAVGSNTTFAVNGGTTIDEVTIGNSSVSTTTDGVDAFVSTIYTTNGGGTETNSAIHGIIGNTARGSADTINGLLIDGIAQTVASATMNLASLLPASSGNTNGTLNGLNIGDIGTPNSATENAIKIGGGWDNDILFKTDGTHTLRVEAQDTAATAGSGIQLLGATGNTSGAGGAITLTSGTGGSSGAGGALNLNGGASGGADGAGGAVVITAGAGAGTGIGGAVTITAGNAVTGNAAGGGLTFASGNGAGTNQNAGTISIDTGTVTGSGTATINIGTSNATALNFGTAASSTTISIGTGQQAAAKVINIGYGGSSETSTQKIFIGNGTQLSANAPLIYIGNGSNNSRVVFRDYRGSDGQSKLSENGQVIFGNAGNVAASGRIWMRSAGVNFRFNSVALNADYSEFLRQQDTSEPGDVMVFSSGQDDTVQRSTTAYSSQILGVITEHGTGGNSDSDSQDSHTGPGWANVGMLGQVYTSVTTENGEIRRGDPLTSSSERGKAMKATRAGRIVGYALEGYDGTPLNRHPEWSYFDRPNDHAIMALVQAAWYNPGDPPPASINEITINHGQGGDYALTDSHGRSWDNVLVADQAAFANLKVGGLQVQEISGHQAAFDQINTNNLTVDLNGQNGQFRARGIVGGQQQDVFTIDSSGNAFFSGTITARGINGQVEGLQNIQNNINNLTHRVEGLEMNPPQPPSATMPNFQFNNHGEDLNMTILGTLNVQGLTTVNGPAQFKEETTFDKLVTFISNVIFRGEVTFDKIPTFNEDTAGLAKLERGKRYVKVVFDNEYVNIPIVNATIYMQPLTQEEYEHRISTGDCVLPISLPECQMQIMNDLFNGRPQIAVTQVTTHGFLIVLDKNSDTDILFSWNALAVKTVKTRETPSGERDTSLIEQLLLSPTPTVSPSVTPSISPTPSPSPTPSTSPSPTPPISVTPTQTPTPTVPPPSITPTPTP